MVYCYLILNFFIVFLRQQICIYLCIYLFIYLSSARKKATAEITIREYRQYYEKRMLKSQIGPTIIQQEGKNVKPNLHILITLPILQYSIQPNRTKSVVHLFAVPRMIDPYRGYTYC